MTLNISHLATLCIAGSRESFLAAILFTFLHPAYPVSIVRPRRRNHAGASKFEKCLGTFPPNHLLGGFSRFFSIVSKPKKPPRGHQYQTRCCPKNSLEVPILSTHGLIVLCCIAVHRIVSEAYSLGWVATRWIPGGVGVYMGFLVLAPRLHAFGKTRGYMTISEFIYDRYLPPSGAPWVSRR